MKFIFKTNLTMKPQDRDRWWIDDYVKNITIISENLKTALTKYRTYLEDENGILLSNNTLKKLEPIYCDDENGNDKQIGYIFTGKTIFDNGHGWTDKYIDVWTEILTIVDTDFEN